jgi:hypothetical protein
VLLEPLCCADNPLGKKGDIETQMPREGIESFLVGGEQVEKQRRKASSLQLSSDKPVARAEAAAAAAMGKENHAACPFGDGKSPLQLHAIGHNGN